MRRPRVGRALLPDRSASRHDVAEIAELLAKVSHVTVLPVFQQMLDVNLAHCPRRGVGMTRGPPPATRPKNSQTYRYARALAAVNAPSTAPGAGLRGGPPAGPIS